MTFRQGRIVLTILVLVMKLQFTCIKADHVYDVLCEMKLDQRLPSPLSSFDKTDEDPLRIFFKSECSATNNDSVLSETSGTDDSDIYCLTYACHCHESRTVYMATCLQASSSQMILTCQCCAGDKAVCRDNHRSASSSSSSSSPPSSTVKTPTVMMAALVDKTSKVPSAHLDGHEHLRDSGSALAPNMVAFLTVSGTIILAAFVFLYVLCKLKYCKPGPDSGTANAIASGFVFPAYVRMPRTCSKSAVRCTGRKESLAQVKHAPVSRSRSQSYNGGELAKDPIREDDEENVDQ